MKPHVLFTVRTTNSVRRKNRQPTKKPTETHIKKAMKKIPSVTRKHGRPTLVTSTASPMVTESLYQQTNGTKRKYANKLVAVLTKPFAHYIEDIPTILGMHWGRKTVMPLAIRERLRIAFTDISSFIAWCPWLLHGTNEPLFTQHWLNHIRYAPIRAQRPIYTSLS